MPRKITLSEYITQAVDEIVEAHRLALERGVPFLGFEECEIECALELQLSPKGEVNLYAVKIGTSAKQVSGHKVRVLYKPYDPQKHTLQAAALTGKYQGTQGAVPSSERATNKLTKTKSNRKN